MNGSGRASEDAPRGETGPSGRIDFLRGSSAEAERMLAEQERRRADLRRQIDAVVVENRRLERDLLQKLGEWRKLDDGQQFVEDVLPQIRAVTRTMPYRFAVGVRALARRLRRLFPAGR